LYDASHIEESYKLTDFAEHQSSNLCYSGRTEFRPHLKEHPMNTAITYSRYGGPEVLSLSETEVPQPGPGQVRIRVKAVAVNLIDAKIRSGRLDGVFPARFPVLPGWDVAGVVDAAGDGASAATGDEVFGVASAGGYSQYALLDRPVPKPGELSFETAAAVVTVGEAAFRVLKHLALKAGQTLLILGAGGSVGSIAAQLAAARGITVVGTAAEADLARLTALGVTAVRYGDGWAGRVRAAAPAGVDAVFDTSGAGLLPDAIALAGDAARVITIADESAPSRGVRFAGQDPADRAPEALPELAAMLAAGELDLPLWRSYPLTEAARAHADLDAHRNHGKIVLLP
jgi:NADPH:quinone reductase-like Zn-dependent oxidoreductase